MALLAMLMGIAPPSSADGPLESLQTVSASQLRSGLPDEPFAAWLQGVVGHDTEITWSGPHGCEEAIDSNCFSAEAEVGDCLKVVAVVGVRIADVEVKEKFQVEIVYIEGPRPVKSFSMAHLEARLDEAKRVVREGRTKPARPIHDAEAIAYVKALDVKRLDDGLSSRPLSEWFEELADADSSISWQFVGCEGKREGLLGAKGCPGVLACVVGELETQEAKVRVAVEVGTYRRGISETPEIFDARLFKKHEGQSWVGRDLLRYKKGSGWYTHESGWSDSGLSPLRKLPIALEELRD